jgi:AcrR family transcriptional regulator
MSTDGRSTRERILDNAFELSTAERSSGISMRKLADRCELNVATLYHHFPSKAALLRAVLEERGYPRRIGEQGPPPEVVEAPTPDEVVRRLLLWLWQQAEAEEAAWRLLIGEGLRGEPEAREEARRLVGLIEPAVRRWLGEAAPELGDRLDVVARVVRSTLLSLAVEHLALGPDDGRARQRVDDLVAALDLR